MRRTTDPKKAHADAAKSTATKSAVPPRQGKNAQGYNQALKQFSCPLCLAPGGLLITLTVSLGKGTAVFQCGECKREGRTGAGSIQYPYKMSFAPKLQKKVDVFFKFRDYVSESGLTGAASAASPCGVLVSSSSSTTTTAQVGTGGALLGGSLLGDVFAATQESKLAPTETEGERIVAEEDEDDDDDLDGLFGGAEEDAAEGGGVQ